MVCNGQGLRELTSGGRLAQETLLLGDARVRGLKRS